MANRYIAFGPNYHRMGFDVRNLPAIARKVEPILKEFDIGCLVGVGLSGCVPGAALSALLKVPFMALRPMGKTSAHNNEILSGCIPRVISRWAFIDDLIDTGRTLKYTIDTLKSAKQGFSNPYPAVILLYEYSNGKVWNLYKTGKAFQIEKVLPVRDISVRRKRYKWTGRMPTVSGDDMDPPLTLSIRG